MTVLTWVVVGGSLWAAGGTVVALLLGAVLGRTRPEPPAAGSRRPASSQLRSRPHLHCTAGRTLSRG